VIHSLLRRDGGAFCALARSCKGSFLGNCDARKRVVSGKYTKYVINTNSQHIVMVFCFMQGFDD
jgi:hypothetical protein